MSANATVTFGHTLRSEWMLEPEAIYLNHGTVGATPRCVLAAQQAFRDEMERHPARFQIRELADVHEFPMTRKPRLRVAAAEIAAFVGAREDDLVFVDNATTGCNAVLRAWDFGPGDEILVTDHGYGAVTKTAEYVASRTGAKVRTVVLPWPHVTPEAVVQAVRDALTPAARMLVVDHICAPTALVLPLREIAAACRERGVLTLVDGAHAPGMLPLELGALGCDFYTGNLHKWAMAPRSSAILWVAPEHQPKLHPTVISWGFGFGIAAEFDLLGTRDATAHLAAPAGVAFMRGLGLDAMRAYNHGLAWEAAQRFAAGWGTAVPAPESMYGSMVTVRMGESWRGWESRQWEVKTRLLERYHIETQPLVFRGELAIRLAAQVYNERSDFDALWTALEEIRKG